MVTGWEVTESAEVGQLGALLGLYTAVAVMLKVPSEVGEKLKVAVLALACGVPFTFQR
jgi:hypothetical protein